MFERLSQWLTQWRPVEVIGLVGVLALALVLLRALKYWRRIREVAAKAEREKSLLQFTREMADRGLSAEQIEQLLKARPPDGKVKLPWSDEKVAQTLAKNLTRAQASAPATEEVLTLVREANPETRRATAKAVKKMVSWQVAEERQDEEQILGLVRGLCRTADIPRESPREMTLEKLPD